MFAYGIFAIGAALMMGAATFLIDSISKIAERLKMGGLLAGSALLALIITFPELVNNVMASLYQVESLGLGNLIGLVLLDNFFFLGLFYIFRKRRIKKIEKWHIGYFLFSITIILILAADSVLDEVDGAILLAIFFPYLILSLKRMSKKNVHMFTKENAINYLFLFISVFIIVISSWLIVSTSEAISKSFGIGLDVLGITLLSFVTAFPEYSSGITAMRRGKKERDIVVGSIYGANMINLIFISGLAAVIHPIKLTGTLFNSLFFILFGMIFIYAFMQKRELGKEFGVFNFLIYIVYLALLSMHAI